MAAGGQHQVYITAHFGMTGEWAGELAQCGWRMGYAPVGSLPGRGASFTPQPANITDAELVIGEDATWRWTSAWLAEWGADQWAHTQNLAAANAVITYMNAVKGFMAQVCRLESVKIALINPDGTYAFPSSIYALKTPIVGMGTVGQTNAPEVSVATTLRAPVLGRRGRGRWYLPAPLYDASLTVNIGKVREGFRTGLANAGKDLVQDFDDIGTGATNFAPVLAVASAASATMIRPAEVRVGDHFDVQRRRQHQVPEVYTSVSL